MDLRQAAKRERILQVARSSDVPEVAAFEKAGQTLDRHAEPVVRACLVDGRMEHREVCGERLEVEGARDLDRIEQPREICDRERGVGGRERVVVDERESL